MPNPNCYGALNIIAVRVATLAANGAPATGANRGYVTSSVTQAKVSPDLLKGVQETVQAGNNNLCQYYRDCDRLKSFDIDMTFCALEPELFNFLTGSTALTSPGTGIYAAGQSGKGVGAIYSDPTASCTNGVCLEFWELAWNQTEQATSTLFAAAGTLTYIHHVFPRVFLQVDDATFDNKFRDIKVTGFARTNSKITINGPFDDWPTAVTQANGFTSGLGGFFYDNAVPTAACGSITVPSAAS